MASRRSVVAAGLTAMCGAFAAPVRRIAARLGAAVVPPAPPARRRVYVNAGANPLSLAAMKRLGISKVRFTLYWNNYLDTRAFAADRSTPVPAGTPGSRTVAEWFAIDIAAFLAAGIDPLILVHTPPHGMSRAAGITAMPAFMAARAAQFRGRTWEIMNEMNGEDAFNGGWFQASNHAVSERTRGDWYGQLLGPVYDAIKRADPTAIVVTGGIDRGFVDFHGALRSRAPGRFDAFCVHSYGPPASTPFAAFSETMRPVLGRLPLWNTEFGNPSTDDAAQAADIARCLDDNDRNDRYDRIYLYCLAGGAPGFSVVKPGGALRPAAVLLENRTAP